MKRCLIARLRCLFCGAEFICSGDQPGTDDVTYAILECPCGRYPVVAGIPILQKEPARLIAKIVGLLEADQQEQALFLAVSPLALYPPASPGLAPRWIRGLPSVKGVNRLKDMAHRKKLREWEEQAKDLLRGRSVTATRLLQFFLGPNKDAFDYFALRFGQPRHLVALSFASMIESVDRPVIDLACGYGHVTRGLLRRAGRQPVIGLDPNFFGLFVAKTFIAPEAEYICCVTDSALPFPDGFASVAFCSDAFHYFQNKMPVVRELTRLTEPDGLMILTWVHNRHVRLPHDGLPLPPDAYQHLVADLRSRVISDDTILDGYLQKRGPALERQCEMASLTTAPLLSIVAGREEDVFRDHGTFDRWPHACGRLDFNPLYAPVPGAGDGNVELRRILPSALYAQDHAQCSAYMPESVRVPSAIFKDIAHTGHTADVAKLIEQCVVLDIPERYR